MTQPEPDYSVGSVNFELNKAMSLAEASDWWLIEQPALGTTPSLAYHEQGRKAEVFNLAASLSE